MSQKLSAIPAGVVTLSPSDLMYVAVDAGGGVFTKGRMPVSVLDARFEAALGYVAADVADPLSQFAATTSAQLAAVISDETGSGLLVFNDTPTFITPNLGVASATSIIADTLDATVSMSAPTITGSSIVFTFLSGGTISGTTLALSDAATITQLSANTKIFSTTGYSLTGASAVNMFDLAGTWNTSGSPTAIKLNITNTASGAAALLFDLQASTVSQFSVSKAGNVIAAGSLTLGVDLTVPNGGTGASTFTDGGVLIGNAAGILQVTTAGNVGEVLTSNGAGVDPTFQAAAGAPFTDTTAIVKGSADATKLLRFEVDGFTTATTRVLTPPNQDATIAGLQVLQTFTVTQTFSPAVNTPAVIVSGFSLTGSEADNIVDISGTWNTDNNSSAIFLNITATAYGEESQLLNLQTDSNPVFTVSPVGSVMQTGFLDIAQSSANTKVLSVAGYSLTGSSAVGMVDLSGTWNTSGSPTAIKLNITNTASGAASLLLDLQASTVSQFSVSKAGLLSTKAITMATASVFSVLSGTNTRAGNAVLVAGTVTVSNTTVTANTLVMLTRKTSGGTLGTAITYTVSAGASFTINSDSALDTSTFSYFLIENV